VNDDYVILNPDGLYPVDEFNRDLHDYCIEHNLPTYDLQGIHVGRLIAKNYRDVIARWYSGTEPNRTYNYKGILKVRREPKEKKGGAEPLLAESGAERDMVNWLSGAKSA